MARGGAMEPCTGGGQMNTRDGKVERQKECECGVKTPAPVGLVWIYLLQLLSYGFCYQKINK